MQPRRGGRIVLTAQTADLRVYNTHAESGNNDALRMRQAVDELRVFEEGETPSEKSEKPLTLVVEDNPEMRRFLVERREEEAAGR